MFEAQTETCKGIASSRLQNMSAKIKEQPGEVPRSEWQSLDMRRHNSAHNGGRIVLFLSFTYVSPIL